VPRLAYSIPHQKNTLLCHTHGITIKERRSVNKASLNPTYISPCSTALLPSYPADPPSPHLQLPRPAEYLLDHLIAKLDRLREAGRKVLLWLLESHPVPIEVLERDGLTPSPRRERELEVVAAEFLVVQCETDAVVKKLGLAEEVLCCAEPETEELYLGLATVERRRRQKEGMRGGEQGEYGCGADHVVVWNYAALMPTVDHGEQR